MGYDKIYKTSYFHVYSAYIIKVCYQCNKQRNVKFLEYTTHQIVENGK